MTADWPTLSVVVALGALLWRQQAALGVEIAALRSEVRGVDRRLARLEGRLITPSDRTRLETHQGAHGAPRRERRGAKGSPQADAGGLGRSPI